MLSYDSKGWTPGWTASSSNARRKVADAWVHSQRALTRPLAATWLSVAFAGGAPATLRGIVTFTWLGEVSHDDRPMPVIVVSAWLLTILGASTHIDPASAGPSPWRRE